MNYKLDEKEFPIEMRFKAGVGTLNKYLSVYNLAIYEKLGDEGVELIAKIWSDMADEFFLKSFEKLGFKGDGPKDIAEWFAKSDAIVGHDTDFFVVSDKKAGFRVNRCPWFKSPSSEGARICSEGVIGFEKRAAQLLNPKIKVSMNKFFHKGDNCCEYIFEIPEE
ncbi:MAG TPA: L-2-amino-thiazoline-4-carboxylic acid hydrolase [Desulfatiglandales bacterium]|nr:L-2-amino-thiazoline-4-carboxylic acid hydrolase [Desulfatiglandales bacterium]